MKSNKTKFHLSMKKLYLKNTELTKAFDKHGSNGNAAMRLPKAVKFSSSSNAPRSCNSETAISMFSKLG